MKRHAFLSTLIILFIPAILYSQIILPSQAILLSHPVTVAEVRHLPNNSWVTLTGNIVNSLPGGLNYIFRDSTGEITIRIEHRVWRGLFVSASDIVEISGDVRVTGGLITINVEAISGSSLANTGPGLPITMNRPITVREARELPHDSWIILNGNIVEALPGGRNYTFRDSTGDIIIELELRVWRGLSVGVSDRVEISGDIRINRGLVTINTKAIRRI